MIKVRVESYDNSFYVVHFVGIEAVDIVSDILRDASVRSVSIEKEEPVVDTEKEMNSKTRQIKENVEKQLDRIKEIEDHCRSFEEYMSQRKNVEDMSPKEQIEDYAKRSDYWTGLIEGERAAYQQKHEEYISKTSDGVTRRSTYLPGIVDSENLPEVIDEVGYYSNVCPMCGSLAYVGLFKVNCSNPDCEKYNVK